MKNRKTTVSLRVCMGFLFLIGFLLLSGWTSLCIGRVDFSSRILLTAAAVSLVYTILAGISRRKRWAKRLCAVYEIVLGFSAVVLLGVTILLNGTAAKTAVSPDKPDADYVIVFGAGVHGETPSLILYNRTKTAYTYLKDHPTTKAVLSGGMGDGESITEAEAMRRLLTDWGVEADRLILEERSTDTGENAKYTAELIEDKNASVLAVSNAFHLRRCMEELVNAGFCNISTLSAPLPSRGTAVSMYIRETVATIYHLIFH